MTNALILRVFSVVFLYPTAILLARLLGVAGYGVYGFVMALLNLLIIFSMVGMDHLIVREIAVKSLSRETGAIAGIIRFGLSLSVGLATALAVLTTLVVFAAPGMIPSVYAPALAVGIWILPCIAFSRIFCAALRGQHQTTRALIPQYGLQPLLFLALIMPLALGARPSVSPLAALVAQFVAYGSAAATAFALWNRARPVEANRSTSVYTSRVWISSAVPLLLTAGAHQMETYVDRLMLAFWFNSESVGLYLVAARHASMIQFFISSSGIVMSPIIAQAFRRRDHAGIQHIIGFQALLVGLLSVGAAIGLCLFSDVLLSLFGPQFAAASPALLILSTGYAVSILFGMGDHILIMSGQERVASGIFWSATVLNVVMNLILIPQYGIEGAALATAISETLKRATLALIAIRLMDVNPTIVSGLRFLHKVASVNLKGNKQ